MYVWDAEDYSSSSSQQKKWGRELLAKLHLEGHERVLDIGCGDGILAVEIADLVPEGSVLGIDSSKEMIQHASESFPPEEYPNISWMVLDATHLDFEGEFDVVFSNATLHWIKDHLPVLHGIKRSLVPDGTVLIQMGGKGSVSRIAEVLVMMLARDEWGRYFTEFSNPFGFYGPEEYAGWLEQVGLEARRVELVTKDMVHTGREGLAGWIRSSWHPFTQRIPEDLREKFIYELVDEYVRRYPPDEEGLVHVPAVRLEVEATNR